MNNPQLSTMKIRTNADRKAAKEKERSVQSYVYELNRRIRAVHGKEEGDSMITKLHDTIRATAQCQMLVDKITDTLISSDIITTETGSQGQIKRTVSPLLPIHEKYLGRLSNLLYELGLTNRKQAAKAETDTGTLSPMQQMLNALNQ